MTRIDTLMIRDTVSGTFVMLTHGDDVRIRLDRRKLYTWLRISVTDGVARSWLSSVLRSIGDTVDIEYREYRRTVSLRGVPKMVRSTPDNGWRHFSLRMPSDT